MPGAAFFRVPSGGSSGAQGRAFAPWVVFFRVKCVLLVSPASLGFFSLGSVVGANQLAFFSSCAAATDTCRYAKAIWVLCWMGHERGHGSPFRRCVLLVLAGSIRAALPVV